MPQPGPHHTLTPSVIRFKTVRGDIASAPVRLEDLDLLRVWVPREVGGKEAQRARIAGEEGFGPGGGTGGGPGVLEGGLAKESGVVGW